MIHTWVYTFIRWSSLRTTNVKGTDTFELALSLELDVVVPSWLKLKARHDEVFKQLSHTQCGKPSLCIHLHLSTMWTSTRIKHVVLRNAYLDLVLVSTWACPYQHMIINNSFNDIFVLIRLNLHTTILMTIATWRHPSWVVWDLPFDASPWKHT